MLAPKLDTPAGRGMNSTVVASMQLRAAAVRYSGMGLLTWTLAHSCELRASNVHLARSISICESRRRQGPRPLA